MVDLPPLPRCFPATRMGLALILVRNKRWLTCSADFFFFFSLLSPFHPLLTYLLITVDWLLSMRYGSWPHLLKRRLPFIHGGCHWRLSLWIWYWCYRRCAHYGTFSATFLYKWTPTILLLIGIPWRKFLGNLSHDGSYRLLFIRLLLWYSAYHHYGC